MGRIRQKPFHPVLQRVLQALGIDSAEAPGREFAELALALGKSEGVVRNWHKRDAIPLRELIVVAKRTGKRLEWLTGTNAPLSDEAAASNAPAAAPRSAPEVGRRAENAANTDGQVIVRVKRALGVNSLDAVADKIGEKRATVGSWSARQSVPLDALLRVAEIANCSLDSLVRGSDWLPHHAWPQHPGALGIGPVVISESPAPWRSVGSNEVDTPQPNGPRDFPEVQGGDAAALLQPRGARAVLPLVLSLPLGANGGRVKEYQVIPTHVRHAVAGKSSSSGSEIPDQVSLAGEMAFSFDWLRRTFGHTTGRLSSVLVRGTSMATTLLDGDTIIVDEGVQHVDVDHIYVFDFNGRRMVKRLQQLTDGTLLIISDNPNYKLETVPRDRARDIRVIGRMVWPRIR
jgi:hypothetical protein